MKYLSKEKYKSELLQAKKRSKQKSMRREIKAAEKAWKADRPHIETSKKLAVYLFILLNVVVVYCLVVMWHFADLTYLGVLITDIAAQILIYGIYCLKAYKAKKSSEDMKFKRERLQGIGEVITAGAESQEYVPVKGNMAEFQYNENGTDVPI